MESFKALEIAIKAIHNEIMEYKYNAYDEDTKKDYVHEALVTSQLLMHLAYQCLWDYEIGSHLRDSNTIKMVSNALDIITLRNETIERLSNQICNSEFEQICNELDYIECEYQLTKL